MNILKQIFLMIVVLMFECFPGNSYAWKSSDHNRVATGAILQTEEPLRSLLLRNKNWMMAGAHLPDVYYSAEVLGRSYRDLFESTVEKPWNEIKPALKDALETSDWENHYGISNDEILSWQLPWYWYGHRKMAAHQFVDELAGFIRDGDEHKIAFVCGVWTHYLEIMTWVGKTYANILDVNVLVTGPYATSSNPDLNDIYKETLGTVNLWSPITGMIQDYIASNIALTDEKMSEFVKKYTYSPNLKNPDEALQDFRLRSEESGFRIIKLYFDLMYKNQSNIKTKQDLKHLVEQSYAESALCATVMFNFAQKKASTQMSIKKYDTLESAPSAVLSLTKEKKDKVIDWLHSWVDFTTTKISRPIEIKDDNFKSDECIFDFIKKFEECEKGTYYLEGSNKIGFDSGGAANVDISKILHISVPSGQNWSIGSYMKNSIDLPKLKGKIVVLSFFRAALNLGKWGKVIELKCNLKDVNNGKQETLLHEFIQGKEKIGEWKKYCFNLNKWAGRKVEIEFIVTMIPNFRTDKEIGLKNVRIELIDDAKAQRVE